MSVPRDGDRREGGKQAGRQIMKEGKHENKGASQEGNVLFSRKRSAPGHWPARRDRSLFYSRLVEVLLSDSLPPCSYHHHQ